MIRNFDATITYGAIDEGLKQWVAKNQRPLVVPFDERTIGDMFGSSKLGVVLFNGANNNVLLDAFTEAAKEYAATDKQSLIFTEINDKSEHLENFANYIKINHKETPIVFIEASSQTKYVMKEEATKENIVSFLDNYQDFKYGITDEVKAEGEATEEPAAAEEGEL